MDQGVTNILEEFARNTRLSKDDTMCASKVLQRYIAVHVNVAPTAIAYAVVSDDYKMLELKATNPPLHVYRTGNRPINTGALITACQNMSGSSHSFDAFRETVLPRPIDEETWVYMSNTTQQWKDKAYFMALNFKEHATLKPLIESIYAYPAERVALMDTEPDRIYKEMLQYEPKQNPTQLAHDIGRMIASIQVESNDIIIANVANDPLQFKVDDELPVLRKKKSSTVIINSEISPITESFAQLRPEMEAYRKRAGLNATIDTKKLAKQMIYVASELDEDAVPRDMLGRFQKKLAPLVGDEEKSVALRCVDAFASVPKTFQPNNSERIKTISAITKRKQWDAKMLLKAAIVPQAFLDAPSFAKYQKIDIHRNHDVELCAVISELE